MCVVLHLLKSRIVVLLFLAIGAYAYYTYGYALDVLYDDQSVISVAEATNKQHRVGIKILQQPTSTPATSKYTPEPHQMAFVTAVSPISAHQTSHHRANYASIQQYIIEAYLA